MRVTVKNLGLAAYIKLQGGIIVGSTAHTVTFETDQTGQEWRQSYANSDFSRFNSELIELQNLKKVNNYGINNCPTA